MYLTRTNPAHNAYCLSLHLVHSIADAKPALNALGLLLEYMATEKLEDLAWGTEVKNLPPGPVTVTGGPREDWGTNGMALIQKFQTVFADQTVRYCDIISDLNFLY